MSGTTITPDLYFVQPRGWRDSMDAWMVDMGLPKDGVALVSVSDGQSKVKVLKRGNDGRCYFDEVLGEPAHEWRTVPSVPPPLVVVP